MAPVCPLACDHPCPLHPACADEGSPLHDFAEQIAGALVVIGESARRLHRSKCLICGQEYACICYGDAARADGCVSLCDECGA